MTDTIRGIALAVAIALTAIILVVASYCLGHDTARREMNWPSNTIEETEHHD